MQRLLVMLTFLASLVGTNVHDLADEGLESRRAARVVRAAYHALEGYAAWPTVHLSFDLTHFETLSSDQLDQILYVDLATLPEGQVIAMTRSTNNLDGTDVLFRRYVPRWESSDGSWRHAPEAQRMKTMTAAEVLAEGGLQDPDLASVEKVTRYEVTVRLAGKSRSYTAAFLWLPSGTGPDSLRFRALDHITQGVGEAVSESLPTLEEARRILRQREKQATRSESPDEERASKPLGLSRPVPSSNPRLDGSPIVIDLAGDGFLFTSAEGGVSFDLDADGSLERVAWTTAGSDDAFLVTDWNQNGIIDHGRELFGTHSAQLEPPPGEERHGYNALRWYDEEAGGNDDGWISADDTSFNDLWLWLDRNHNGYSEPGELYTLPAMGIERIDLDYVEARRRDAHGNLLRYTSAVIVGAGPERLLPGKRSRTQATDVFLVAAEP